MFKAANTYYKNIKGKIFYTTIRGISHTLLYDTFIVIKQAEEWRIDIDKYHLLRDYSVTVRHNHSPRPERSPLSATQPVPGIAQ